jgi:GNAT acetyltransferase
MSTPELQLETMFVLDAAGRIVSTREPQGTSGPLFSLIRSSTNCAWALRTDVVAAVADELNSLARDEPPLSDLRDVPVHADRYKSLIKGQVHSGPAFRFPETITLPSDVVVVEDESLLERHFQGWVAGEIAAGRAPVMAILESGNLVSVCFCARHSNVAAEAGVETTARFRGRGFGPSVTAAWALAVRASGQIPLYSTEWSNEASLAVARELKLEVYATDWSISES